MRQTVLPLPVGVVDQSHVIYCVSGWVFRADWGLEAGAVAEWSQLLLDLKHDRMRPRHKIHRRKVAHKLVLPLHTLISQCKVRLLVPFSRRRLFQLQPTMVLVDAVVHLLVRAALLAHA
jgi:hypothetical protein